jgi:1-acyl-sn-glycerol-3-phosphate acyltransferase
VFPIAAIRRQLHRRVWTLGEHAWWRFPFLRRVAAAVGTVDGTPENADRLLQDDELVLVLPGGLRESVKPRELRYRLLWGHRYGFVKAAIRNGAPIVPIAAIGADDIFDLAGDAYARGQRWLHRRIPIPLPSHLPHRVPLRYVFGEPIPMRVPPESACDPATLHAVRHEVEGALHELIETELAHRAGIELD